MASLSYPQGFRSQSVTSSSSDGGSTGSNRMRAAHSKVRTGCATCRKRKVKCDEGRPHCKRCLSTGRTCDGYHAPPPIRYGARRSKYESDPFLIYSCSKTEATSISGGAVISPTLSAIPHRPYQQDEARSFEYFLTRAAHKISSFFEKDFWIGFVPRTSVFEPPVWHALLALSSLQEVSELTAGNLAPNPSPSQADKRYQFAVQHYNKSVALLATTMSFSIQQPHTVLTCCLIFIWIEFIRDNLDTALAHLQSGLKILFEQGESLQKVDAASSAHLSQLFNRIHVQAMLHGSPTLDFDSLAVIPKEHASWPHDFLPAQSREIFKARAALDAELLSVFHFHRQIEGLARRTNPDPEFISSSVVKYTTRLQGWMHSFKQLVTTTRLTDIADTLLRAAFLQMELQYHFVLNTLQTLNPPTPMVFDTYNDVYARMVDLCDRILHADTAGGNKQGGAPKPTMFAHPFDTSLMAHLFYIVLKCRHYTTRHRALELVRLCSAFEGAWSKNSVLEFGEWKVGFEEGLATRLRDEMSLGTAPDLAAQDGLIVIPESARIWAEKVVKDEEESGTQILQYRRGSEAMEIYEEVDVSVLQKARRMKGVIGT